MNKISVVLMILILGSLFACSSVPEKKGLDQRNFLNKAFSDLDANVHPLVAITPNYPAEALANGIEGFCSISFQLKPYKSLYKPTDVKVSGCNPGDIFKSACEEVVERWIFSVSEGELTSIEQPLKSECAFQVSEL